MHLTRHLSVFPADRGARDLSDALRLLRERIEALLGAGAGELDALLSIGPSVAPDLMPAWHARVATVAERELGADARVGAEPLGFHLMRAREYEGAIVALRAALARNGRDGRARSLLADALFSCGQRAAARREYLRAF